VKDGETRDNSGKSARSGSNASDNVNTTRRSLDSLGTRPSVGSPAAPRTDTADVQVDDAAKLTQARDTSFGDASATQPVVNAETAPTNAAVSNPIAHVVANLATLLDPLAATTTPAGHPAQAAALWTVMTFTRRDFETAFAQPSSLNANTNPVAAELFDDTTTITVQPLAATADAQWEDLYTGQPSLLHDLVAFAASLLDAVVSPFVGSVLAVVPYKIPFITDGVPPFFFNYGLTQSHSEFEGMPVVTFTPREPTGKVVVAIHGGAYVGEATIFHWWTYTDMARQTGATVVVPDYTLSPQGTAQTEVPRMADFISQMIEEHGAENVSVLGDSAGGGFALLVAQELARRGSPQPSRFVLLAPWLDVSTSDPRQAQINDPLLDVGNLVKDGRLWAGSLDTQDPRVSPLFGPLNDLPPIYVYSSSRDTLAIDTVRLRDRVLAEDLSNFTFRLRKGLLHDWVIYAPLPDAQAERANLYQDLGLNVPSSVSAR
jgi:acetyl esterase/lipase